MHEIRNVNRHTSVGCDYVYSDADNVTLFTYNGLTSDEHLGTRRKKILIIFLNIIIEVPKDI
jgi:hypothetical protein